MGSKGIANKITNKQVFELHDSLSNLKSLKGVQLNYAIARNTAYAKSEVEAMKKTLEASEGYIKYDEARIDLNKKYSKKDEKGEPVIITKVENNRPVQAFDLADQEAFDREFDILKEEYKKEIDDRQTQLKDFEELLKEKSTIDFHKIKLELIPEDVTTEQMNALLPIIIEE